MIYIIYTLIFWVMYSTLEGLREAFYWHYKGIASSTDGVDLHPIFTLQRGILLFTLMFFMWVTLSSTVGVLIFLANALLFSFFHNGMMYLFRNKLDSKVYPKKWFDQSTTSTAKTTKFMTPVSRTIQAILGLGIYITILIYFI